MPAILCGVFFLIYLAKPDDFAGSGRFVSLAGYFLLCFVWGVRLASDSVANEVRDRTWDTQRMSAISPWSMTW